MELTMGQNSIPGEKKCVICGCMFLNKVEPTATKCKACKDIPEDKPVVEDVKYVHQDVDVVELKKQVDRLTKIVEKLAKETDKRPEYSKKCEACGQVFVSNSSASKYCESCKDAKN